MRKLMALLLVLLLPCAALADFDNAALRETENCIVMTQPGTWDTLICPINQPFRGEMDDGLLKVSYLENDADLRPGDVAVALSHSGSTRATVDAIARAKAAGAVTVAITSFPNSRLAKSCDWRLIAFPDDANYPVEAVSARGAHFCILDALMMSLAARSQVVLDKLLSRRNEVLKQMRY